MAVKRRTRKVAEAPVEIDLVPMPVVLETVATAPLAAPLATQLPTAGWLVLESEPLKGISPVLPPPHFDLEQEAIDYALPRIEFFGQIELCKVTKRAITTLVPQVTLEETTSE